MTCRFVLGNLNKQWKLFAEYYQNKFNRKLLIKKLLKFDKFQLYELTDICLNGGGNTCVIVTKYEGKWISYENL